MSGKQSSNLHSPALRGAIPKNRVDAKKKSRRNEAWRCSSVFVRRPFSPELFCSWIMVMLVSEEEFTRQRYTTAGTAQDMLLRERVLLLLSPLALCKEKTGDQRWR